MKEANKILKKVFALDKQIKTGKTNKYPLIRLIDKHRQDICHQLGLDANSTFLDIGYHAGIDLNPHAGIRNYNGSTFFTILNSGNVGISKWLENML